MIEICPPSLAYYEKAVCSIQQDFTKICGGGISETSVSLWVELIYIDAYHDADDEETGMFVGILKNAG